MTNEQQHHYASEARKQHSRAMNSLVRRFNSGKINATEKAQMAAELSAALDAVVNEIYGHNVSTGGAVVQA